jgi:hypothetical protein
MRILVKNEATAANNGIYVRTSSTVLTRATDYDTVPEVEAGDFTFVTAGTLYDNTGWVQTSSVVTIGTDPIDFAQFSGAGTYTAGTGLTLTGTTFSVNASQTQVTAVGTLTSLSVSGNATVGNLNTAGAVVASTLTSNVATGTAPLTISSTTRVNNLNVAYANVADNINVTAPGTGTGYIVFANATTGNVVEWTSSGITSNLANNSITATTFVGALSGAATSATTAGTVTTAAQPNITSVGTLTSLSSSGNVTGANLIVSSSGSLIHSINASVSAAGTVQGNATALLNDINVITTCASGAGVVLPTAVAGMRKLVFNTTANACLVYPASGAAINAGAANASYSLAAGARLEYISTSSTQWYTVNATYA